MAKLRFFLFLLILGLPLSGWSQLGFTIKDGKTRVEFPIEIANNLVIVPVILNGQLPLRFILDTGVRTTILTEKTFSDILNLQYTKRYLLSGPGGEKMAEAFITNNVTLDLPGVHGQGHAMLVLEEDYLELRNYLGTDVHGVLGYELFSRFVIQVDYERKRLIIMHPDSFHSKKSFQSFDITIEDTKPYIRIPIEMSDGKVVNAKLMVDSGASHGLMLDPLSSKEITVPQKNVSSLIGRGLGGLITGRIGRIKAVNLGKYKIVDPIANFPDANTFVDTLKSTNVPRNGSVCGEILSRFTVIYNFPDEKIFLKRNAYFGKNFYCNMSGLTVKAKGASLRKYEITDIRKDSNADKAGIQNGDEVLSINGLNVSEMDLNHINGLFNVAPGRKIRMELLRKGERLVKFIVLESPI